MMKSLFKHYTIIFLAGILILGFILRHHNFTITPRHGATFDEFAWTWLGINLIQNKYPISWSSQPQYLNKKHLIYQGAAFWIVRPYLEHPPLFGLVAGGFAILRGSYDMYDVTLQKIRPLAITLGVLSIFLVYLFTRYIYGNYLALLSSLLYATIPTVVIGSRIVQNENFLIPLWILSLIFIQRFINTKKSYYRSLAFFIAAIIPLAKVPWLIVSISLFLILTFKGKWKDAMTLVIITLLTFSLFIIYGLLIDSKLFLDLWILQLARYDITFDGFYSIFTSPLLVDRFFIDGWIYFGWFAIFLLFSDFKKHFLVLIPFISYLVIYIFAIPNEPAHGWYRYPFYPFLIVASSYFILQQIRKITPAAFLFLIVVGLSLLQSAWNPIFGFSYFIYRFFILGSFGISFIPEWFRKYSFVSKIMLIVVLVIFIIFNIITVWDFKDF